MFGFSVRAFYTTFLLYFLFHPNVKAHTAKQTKPATQHAAIYKTVDDISKYWVSEKLDGMRAYWTGTQLLTRQGNIIHNPKWFTQHWPSNAMDGELWIARNQFQATISCVRKKNIDEYCWRKVRFMIFDLPKHTGTFTDRIKTMKELTNQKLSTYLDMVNQFKLKSIKQLNQTLSNIIENNGEGLMLHKASAYYHVGRTTNIMKLKMHQDAEATVLAHIGGKGKYEGMLGALKVKTETGLVFKIGSGFSDNERANPPAIDSVITYRYNGKTLAGIPRFARYFRIKIGG
jgi:DNA ligase-1